MIISRLCSLHVLLLCGRLALSATDLGVSDSTISNQTNGGPFVPYLILTVNPVTNVHLLVFAVCLCDLTPGFCDIGCCCDTADCDVANLSTVFTGCPKEDVKQVCIEKWLMFRANVDSSLVTVTDTLFCVQAEGKWIK
uniref:Tectonic-1-3 N-terminal domain-containing protein n=1 Tax=Poecilia mexicana TaxID=48701 RepID=A0A3B3XIE6_9TELE